MMDKVRVLLYFGSFNPVHHGHTAVARYAIQLGVCDELWFVVSPSNPLKEVTGLAPDYDRLMMVEMAVNDELNGLPVRVSDIEFELPRPSYTIDTLEVLSEMHPECEFSILTGADIMPEINRWKEYEKLLANYRFYVYPREGFTSHTECQYIVYLKDAPLFVFSSTDVRNAVSNGEDICGMVSPRVARYIIEHRLYGAE